MMTQNNSDNERTDTEEVEQLTGQEYQWCVDHLDEVIRRLDRVIDLAEGTDVEDEELRDALARATSASLYFKQSVTPEKTDAE